MGFPVDNSYFHLWHELLLWTSCSWPPGCTNAPWCSRQSSDLILFSDNCPCLSPQMLPTALLLLLVLRFGFGQSSHKHQDEDHYFGQQHNPEHDMNVLFGDEVCRQQLQWIHQLLFSWILHSRPLYFIFIHLQDTEEIKNLSPAQQKIKIMEIIKKIDTNADKLLNAGKVRLNYFFQDSSSVTESGI